MAQSAFAQVETEIVSSVVKDIQRLIKEDYLLEAIEKLFDLISDFTAHAPDARGLRSEALQLSARHARHLKAQRHRLPTNDSQEAIIASFLALLDKAESAARLPIGTSPKDQSAQDIAASVNARIVLEPEHTAYDPTRLKQILIEETRRRNPLERQVVAKLENVERGYARGGFKLGPLSLDLIAGEITGVVGMNASGKTTLLRILLGELAPSKGKVSYPALESEAKGWREIKSRLAYVAQLPSPWSGRQRTNLNYTAAAYGLKGKENEELVEWYLYRYGLKDYENASWDEISGGFKIRFELVRALLMRPRLLILDEPLAYLDIVTQQMFLQDLRSIATSVSSPIPIVVTSQHLYEVEAIADRMVILDNGTAIYSGKLGELPTSRDFVMYDIEARAEKAEILERLRPAGLVDMESTTLGWILIFKKPPSEGTIERALLESFGGRLRYFRDISHSTRCLFRSRRGDSERTWVPPHQHPADAEARV